MSKELSILLLAKDMASKTIGNVTKSVGKLGKTSGIVGKGLATMGANLLKLGAIGVGAAAGFLALSIKEGQEAAKVQVVYAKAIANSAKSAGDLKKKLAELTAEQAKTKEGSKPWTKLAKEIEKTKGAMAVMGPVTAQQTALLNAQQTALMNLAGIDDELIKAEQTKLIQMGLSGDAVKKITPLILDLSLATGKDLLTSTVAVGKATMGNAGSLQKFGVFVDKAKFAVDPFVATMEALNQKFGGTTKALSGQFDVRMGALRENLANIREDIGIKLLPALTRIVDVVSTSLIPAFQKFVDRIMPDITKGIDDFATMLETGGAEKAVTGITDALGTMIGLLQAAAGPVKAIVNAFMSLPRELQTILVAGFAINKLSGGMVTQLAGEILFKRGGSPANPLFVADVAGGLGGGALKGGKGILGALTSLPVLIGGAVLVGALAAVQSGIQEGHQAQADANASATERLLRTGSLADLRNALRGLENMPSELDPLKKVMYDLNANGVKTHTETLEQAIRDEIASREKTAKDEATAARGKATDAAREAIRQRAIAHGKKPTEKGIEQTAIANLSRRLTGKDPYTGKPLPRGGAIEKLVETWKPRLEAILDPKRAAVRSRAEAGGKKPTESAIDKTIAKNTARAAEETKRVAIIQASAARAQAILQSVANMQLAVIAAKSFSPQITIPVYVASTTSIRDQQVSTRVRASYGASPIRSGVAKPI